jgi:hypothetical protein
MRFSWRHLLVLLLVGAAGLLACVPGPARAVGEGDEPDPSRRLPARWRDDPAEHRRLKDQWKAFQKLPKKQQDRLRQIDEELNDEPPAARARLWAVLDRYAAWLERLDDKDRQQIESAPDTARKLEVIRALREREWVSHLAKADRDRIDQAAPEDRPKLIEKLRQKERERRQEWQAALRMQEGATPPPGQPPDFWPRVQMYLNKSLIPTLPQPEREELRKAYLRSWPDYAQQVTALAEKYPIQVPPGDRPGIVSIKDLPAGYMQTLTGKPGKAKEFEGRTLRNLQGRWPNFALEVVRVARERKVALPDKPLGPCKREEFMPAVQKFITEQLEKDPAAAKKLDEAKGKWPEYPLAVMSLAKEKGRRVPGTVLPGTKEYWEKAKSAQPE